ncbi:agmatine deiminase family protein [Streptomyces katrae]|nr:agmatine deiminase family protein [Streptomyces katrae]
MAGDTPGALPQRETVPVKIDTIASGGGGIHGSTHDQPGEPAA